MTGNLKNILLIKDEGVKKYIITSIDAFIYVLLIKQVSSDNSPGAILAFVLAKITGLLITDVIIQKLYRKVFSVNLYLSHNVEEVQEKLIEEQISFTRLNGYFLNSKRHILSMHTSPAQKERLLGILKELGIENPTMDISETTVFGKIKQRVEQ